MNSEVTVFEARSSVAMFRKPYTTTSSVSFAFPPPPAIAGMIAAVIGVENGSNKDAVNADYWPYMEGTRVAVRIASQLKWKKHTLNFTNTKDPQKNPRVQVKHQFVDSPRYRIYVAGKLEKRLREFLASGYFVYTPSLGAAYAIAELRYLGTFPWKPVTDEVVGVDSVVPWDEQADVDVLRSGGIFREIVPVKFDRQRTLLASMTVLYQPSPKHKIYLRRRGELDVTQCGEDVVAWFPTW